MAWRHKAMMRHAMARLGETAQRDGKAWLRKGKAGLRVARAFHSMALIREAREKPCEAVRGHSHVMRGQAEANNCKG